MDELIDDADVPQATIGWWRAIASAVAITVVGIVALAYGANAILTKLSSLDRSQRVGVTTAYFFVVLGGLAWGLRRLQRRGVL